MASAIGIFAPFDLLHVDEVYWGVHGKSEDLGVTGIGWLTKLCFLSLIIIAGHVNITQVASIGDDPLPEFHAAWQVRTMIGLGHGVECDFVVLQVELDVVELLVTHFFEADAVIKVQYTNCSWNCDIIPNSRQSRKVPIDNNVDRVVLNLESRVYFAGHCVGGDGDHVARCKVLSNSSILRRQINRFTLRVININS